LSGHRADKLLFIKHNHRIIIEFWDFSWSLLCYILVSILVLGIGVARGQYYWVLGAFLGIVLILVVIIIVIIEQEMRSVSETNKPTETAAVEMSTVAAAAASKTRG